MDRCALFVDAGYALADGAMAVHGTRRRDSVSWDHAGLLKLLAGLARDRTGLPVLRCYWYEAAEGGRTAEHDDLAEMPGLKLRLVNTRPGRREGIESQLRRDIVTLAKSGAIADAFIASADEHLAEIVSEVQDLGLRVVILHIASDGGWTIPQPLRQECDDIVEISGVHVRPFVDLIRGAEPAPREEQQFAGANYGSRSASEEGSFAAAMNNSGFPAQALAAPSGAYQASGYTSAQPYANFGQVQDGPASPDAAGGSDQALMAVGAADVSGVGQFGEVHQNGAIGQFSGAFGQHNDVGRQEGAARDAAQQAGIYAQSASEGLTDTGLTGTVLSGGAGADAGREQASGAEQARGQASPYGQSAGGGFIGGLLAGDSQGQASDAGSAGGAGQHAAASASPYPSAMTGPQHAAHGTVASQHAGRAAQAPVAGSRSGYGQHAGSDRVAPQHALSGHAQPAGQGGSAQPAGYAVPHHAAHVIHSQASQRPAHAAQSAALDGGTSGQGAQSAAGGMHEGANGYVRGNEQPSSTGQPPEAARPSGIGQAGIGQAAIGQAGIGQPGTNGHLAGSGQHAGDGQQGNEPGASRLGQLSAAYPGTASGLPAQGGGYQNGASLAGATGPAQAAHVSNGSGHSGQNGTGRNATGQNGTGHSTTGHGAAGHGGTGHSGSGSYQDGALQATPGSGGTGSPASAVHHLTGLSFPPGSGSAQNGYAANQEANGSPGVTGHQGGHQNGSGQNGTGVHAAPGYQNGSTPNAPDQYGSFAGHQVARPQNGSSGNPAAVNGGPAGPAGNGANSNGNGNGAGSGRPAGFEAAPVPAGPSLYGPIDPGYFGGRSVPGQPGPQAMGLPAAGQPAASQSTSGHPAVGQPTPGQPTPGQPTPGQPTPGQPLMGPPAVGQTGAQVAISGLPQQAGGAQVTSGYAPVPVQPAGPGYQPRAVLPPQPYQPQPYQPQPQPYQPQPQPQPSAQSGLAHSGPALSGPAPSGFAPSGFAPSGLAPSGPAQLAVRSAQPVAISLSEAVKAAHSEGFTFGESVGRDAPGLWLEAVLARKPRMPSDLEARLLQGSVLPIDSLLHDEVRHSLRRGFWDALESARR